MDRLHSRGVGGIILGCTEIPLLVKQHDMQLPLFDTLSIHGLAPVDFALGNESRTSGETSMKRRSQPDNGAVTEAGG